MTEQDLSVIHNRMQFDLFQKVGFGFDDIYYSPDLANSGSRTRKPEPGMLLDALEKWNIDKSKSFFIGDNTTDVLAGINAGVDTIFIGSEQNSNANYNFEDLETFNIKFERVIAGLSK